MPVTKVIKPLFPLLRKYQQRLVGNKGYKFLMAGVGVGWVCVCHPVSEGIDTGNQTQSQGPIFCREEHIMEVKHFGLIPDRSLVFTHTNTQMHLCTHPHTP